MFDFQYSSETRFPKEECISQNERERNVFESVMQYLVVYIDDRFPKEKCITYARPYVYVDEDGQRTYGWIADNGLVLGNVENSCRLEHEFVVGFKWVSDDYIEEDMELFERYKETYEKQWK